MPAVLLENLPDTVVGDGSLCVARLDALHVASELLLGGHRGILSIRDHLSDGNTHRVLNLIVIVVASSGRFGEGIGNGPIGIAGQGLAEVLALGRRQPRLLQDPRDVVGVSSLDGRSDRR